MTKIEDLYKKYFNDVFLYIKRLSGNEHIAEEICSETFFRAMRSLDSFRGECDVRVWLCQIAKNNYYSYLKKTNILQVLMNRTYQKFQTQQIYWKNNFLSIMKQNKYKKYYMKSLNHTKRFLCGGFLRS